MVIGKPSPGVMNIKLLQLLFPVDVAEEKDCLGWGVGGAVGAGLYVQRNRRTGERNRR